MWYVRTCMYIYCQCVIPLFRSRSLTCMLKLGSLVLVGVTRRLHGERKKTTLMWRDASGDYYERMCVPVIHTPTLAFTYAKHI